MGVGEGGTVVVVDGAAVCAGCAGGADGTGRAGVCDAVGTGDVDGKRCAGDAAWAGRVVASVAVEAAGMSSLL